MSKLQRWLGSAGAGNGAPSSLTTTHRQAFLMVEPRGLLAVDREAVTAEQDVQPSVAEPSVLLRQLTQARPQVAIICPA